MPPPAFTRASASARFIVESSPVKQKDFPAKTPAFCSMIAIVSDKTRERISFEFSESPSTAIFAVFSAKPYTQAMSASDACKSFSSVSKPEATSFSAIVSPIPSISNPAIKAERLRRLLFPIDATTFAAPSDSFSMAMLSSFKKNGVSSSTVRV